MRAGALGAEPVEDRHAERADEVAVRAARCGDLAEVEPERAAVLARALEEHSGAFAPLERRSRPATVELDARAGGLGLEAVEEGLDAVSLGRRRHADVDPGSRLGGDDVLARAAGDDADVCRDAALVGERVQAQREPGELLDRARPVLRVAGVRGAAGDAYVEAAEAFARRLQMAT